MEIWKYAAMFFMGTTLISILIMIILAQRVSNNEIKIRRQVQRNKNSNGNEQEYNSSISRREKRKLKKDKKNEK